MHLLLLCHRAIVTRSCANWNLNVLLSNIFQETEVVFIFCMAECRLLNGMVNIFNGKMYMPFSLPGRNERPSETKKASCPSPVAAKQP
jgi:hypothetical protein